MGDKQEKEWGENDRQRGEGEEGREGRCGIVQLWICRIKRGHSFDPRSVCCLLASDSLDDERDEPRSTKAGERGSTASFRAM